MKSVEPSAADGGRIVRGFLGSGGAPGNVFFYDSAGFGESRFIAAHYGSFDVYNNIGGPYDLIEGIRRAWNRETHPLDPNRELLFLYRSSATGYTEDLRALFPEGYEIIVPTTLHDYQYSVFRVPPPGQTGIMQALGMDA